MITLYHLDNSRSLRILWMLEELGLDYKLEKIARNAKTNLAPKELTKIHPAGKSPLLVDGENTLAESGAIIEYLIDKYADGQFRPNAEQDRIRYNYWMHAAEGSIMNLSVVGLVLDQFDKKTPFPFKSLIRFMTGKVRAGYLTPSMNQMLKHIEQQLGEHQWFAGEGFSGADVQMGFVMVALNLRGALTNDFPNSHRWLKQVEQRPAYAEAMRKNGPLNLFGS